MPRQLSLREIHDEMLNEADDCIDGVSAKKVKGWADQLKPYIEAQEGKVFNSHDKKVICVDFDGVIHSYKSGWQGSDVIPDGPLPGAIRWLEKLVMLYDVRIFSARCNSPSAVERMKAWLQENGMMDLYIERLTFEPGKPSAHIIIDDRAWTFDGKFPDPIKLLDFEPWYYSDPAYGRKSGN